MDTSGPRVPSATALGKRKWLPHTSNGASPVRRQPSQSSSDTMLGIYNTEGDLLSKKPRLADKAADSLDSGSPEDTLMQDPLLLAHLPHEILQHIFSFVDPVSLGRLMCVNRSFRILLDPTKSLPHASGKVKHLSIRRQDSIWATSRRTFLPGFPKPMDDMTELDMWKLVRGRSCQFCGKNASAKSLLSGTSPWNAGPGPDSVRSIWPFRVRSCGRCLEPKLVKDSELLVSSSIASALRPGLPFAIFTTSLDYVPSAILQQMEPPPHLQLARYYFRPQMDAIHAKLNEVQELGYAATEEWHKGLEESGRQLSADAARLDQWELQGGLARLTNAGTLDSSAISNLHRALRSPSPEPTQPLDSIGHTNQVSGMAGSLPLPPFGVNDQRKRKFNFVSAVDSKLPSTLSTDQYGLGSSHTTVQMSNASLPSVPTASKTDPNLVKTFPQRDQVGISAPIRPPRRNKPGRTLQEVEQIKAERRQEIERRCQDLVPPILPPTLAFMDAFQAALQIPQPMDDNQWNILKPRLLAQRLDAVRRQEAHEVSLRDPAMQLEEKQSFEEEQRVAQENVNHMWSEIKVPSRDKITRYAREFIQTTWSDGRGVTKATSSKFAAEVLCHVRQRFDEVIALEDKMLERKGTGFPQDAESLSFRKLKLEDMKWTFEEFVKPHTEKFGKELFLCSVCDTNQKLFSFEAVIQHYAAKHTNAFSHGNAVVYWRAEWPVDPPFDPSPNMLWVHEGNQQIGDIRTQGEFAPRAWTAPTEPAPTSSSSHKSYSNELVALVREVWYMTDGIWNMPESLRIWAVIQMTCSRFWQRFNEDLGLHLFLSCIQSRSELQFLQNVAGLQCKTCSDRMDPSLMRSDGWVEFGRALPDLLVHFQRTHIDFDASSHTEFGILSSASRTSSSSVRLDWKRDMILLPSRAEIQVVLHSSSTDPQKLQLIAELLNAPAYTLPHSGGTSSQFSPSVSFRSPVMLQDLRHGDRVRPMSHHGSIIAGRAGSQFAPSEPSIHPSEDDYDRPHHTLVARSQVTEQRKRQPSPSRIPQYDTINYYPVRTSEPREYPFRPSRYDHSWEESSRRHLIQRGALEVAPHDSSWVTPRNSILAQSDSRPEELVESRPASKATSRHSQQVPANLEISSVSTPTAGHRNDFGGREINSAAVEFLNNFDPTSANDIENAETDLDDPGGRPTEPAASGMPNSRQFTTAHQELHSGRSSNLNQSTHEQNTRRHTPSLPIRESGRPHLAGIEYRGELGPGRQSWQDEHLMGPRTVIMDRDYGESLAEQYSRARVESDATQIYGRVARHQDVLYDDGRYYEDRFMTREPKYQTVARPPMEMFRRRVEAPNDRHLGIRPMSQEVMVQDEEYRIRDNRRTRYVPLTSGQHDHVGDYTYSQPVMQERHIAYVGYDDTQYVRETTLGTEQSNRPPPRDFREAGYAPLDRAPRYITR